MHKFTHIFPFTYINGCKQTTQRVMSENLLKEQGHTTDPEEARLLPTNNSTEQ